MARRHVTSIAGVLVGVSVFQPECVVRVFVAELELAPPPKLALLLRISATVI
jgi:hypothetical protein